MLAEKLKDELENYLFDELYGKLNFSRIETILQVITDNKDENIDISEEDLKKVLMYFYDEETSEEIIIEHKEIFIEVLDNLWSKEFDRIFELVLKQNYFR